MENTTAENLRATFYSLHSRTDAPVLIQSSKLQKRTVPAKQARSFKLASVICARRCVRNCPGCPTATQRAKTNGPDFMAACRGRFTRRQVDVTTGRQGRGTGSRSARSAGRRRVGEGGSRLRTRPPATGSVPRWNGRRHAYDRVVRRTKTNYTRSVVLAVGSRLSWVINVLET